MDPVRCAIIGVGGFGKVHIGAVEDLEREGTLKLVSVAEAFPSKWADTIGELKERGIRIYIDYREMLEKERDVELVTISTPMHLHPPMVMDTLEAGYHVLTEKPPALVIQDLEDMIEVRKRSGKLCGVDFQLLTVRAFREMLERVSRGDIGELKYVVAVGTWKRLDSYYERTYWAGKLMVDGIPVLDGPINNAISHILNNCLFLAESANGAPLKPSSVRAELYRGHPIEGEDTSCLEAELENGVKIYFYVTLCSPIQEAPSIEAVGSGGRMIWRDKSLRIGLDGATTEELSFPEPEFDGHHIKIFRNFAMVLRGKEKKLFCPLEKTMNFLTVSNGAYGSAGKIVPIPPKYVKRYEEGESIATEVVDIVEIIDRASKSQKLFSEIDVPWAVSSKMVGLGNKKKLTIDGGKFSFS